ncbi:MAG: GNAT family N-acetyltransferase [Alphaproteobacteria bacterium]|nr:GNAT family N-acetyltransferase [Alphaproteobacteria bacterium]
MPGILIRRAEPEDGPALVAAMAAIDAETEFLGRPGEYGDWPEKAAERLETWREKDVGAYFIAVDRGEIVGFLSAFRGSLRRESGFVSYNQIGLRAGHRGRGIGGRLMEAAEAWARELGVHRITLRVDEENARGLALYKRMGFAIQGRMPRSVDQDGAWRHHFEMGKGLRELPAFEAEAEPAPPGGTLDGVIIGPARAEDAAALRAWEMAIVNEMPWSAKEAGEIASEEEIRAGLARGAANPRQLTLLAWSGTGADTRVLGLVGGGFAEHRMRHKNFLGVTVLREAWGRGIGRELARRYEAWAVDKGARRLTTFLVAPNRRGVRFAERLGYRLEGTSPDMRVVDGKGVARLRMAKLID